MPPTSKKKSKKGSKNAKSMVCPICTFKNPPGINFCQMCNHDLRDGVEHVKKSGPGDFS